jgi:penicillin-binding protein 1A
MASASKPAKAARILLIIAVAAALVLGVLAGIGIAATDNIMKSEDFITQKLALPSKLYDIKGRLITEFYSNEKREIVSIKDLPKHLLDAFVLREDKTFYSHHGFDVKRIVSAAFGVLTHTNRGGGSTITQQLAGKIYADRDVRTLGRKIVELWWALQLERRYTKEEILEQYLNRMMMGPGVYGVEAASKYYFDKSARDTTLEEAVILSLQMNSNLYNPYRYPKNAIVRSREMLDLMVKNGLATKEEADESFARFWDNYNYTRVPTSAYNRRRENDKAPWFSEYVRQQLVDNLFYGSLDLYNDGLVVRTTLDLDQQRAADAIMASAIPTVNRTYQAESAKSLVGAERTYIPIVEMLGLAFDLDSLFVSSAKVKNQTFAQYQKRINPTIDAAALLFGLPSLKSMSSAGWGWVKEDMAKTTVEGALITVEPDTGHITALVGGSKFSEANQFNRAVQAELQPGSSFKPLYYSAAIDSRKFTEATLIQDAPVVFYNEDGTPYTPLDFQGKWEGPVLTWYALARSMNVPSLHILDSIGFDAAIDRASLLLDITDPDEIRRRFPRYYPLGLGTCSVSPLMMARAFSVFANQGREVTPISILSVEDRNGRIILEPERDLRAQQKKKGAAMQLISQQTAAVMVDMLGKVTKYGTLAGPSWEGRILTYTDASGKKYTIPCAGKTGTTQNWSDAWTVGFTPYYTTAIWFGFDTHGNSLGTNQSGATIAGMYWANYMRTIHADLAPRSFQRPQSGLVEATVCSVTGLLPTPSCNEGTTTLLFLEGTQPNKLCDYHSTSAERDRNLLDKIQGQVRSSGEGPKIDSKLKLNLPSLDGDAAAPTGATPAGAPTAGTGASGTTQARRAEAQPPQAETPVPGATDASQSDILN